MFPFCSICQYIRLFQLAGPNSRFGCFLFGTLVQVASWFLPNKGHHMTHSEQPHVKRRPQIMDYEIDKPSEPATHEDTWIRDFIHRLAGVIRKIGGDA
jgi:hypothetical protein